MTEIAQICTEYNLNQTELSKRFEIPLRTVQDWHAGRRTPPDYVVRMIVELLENSAEESALGCEYCSGQKAEYQYTTHTKLYINTFGQARTIETEVNACPPFAQCGSRGIPVRSAFIINYCPHCGRKLAAAHEKKA